RCRTASFSYGYSRSPDCAALTVAERPCGELDRLNPSRVPGPGGDPRRRPFAPDPQSLCCLLQRVPNAPVPGQGCANPSTDPTVRSGRREADPRWASSPILPDLVLGRDRAAVAEVVSGIRAPLGSS